MAEGARPARPPLWRNIRFLRVLGQAVFVIVLILVARQTFANLQAGVEDQGLDLSFSFLEERAGFSIKEGIDYSANDNVLRAFFVAIMNTVFVAAAGIALASGLGLVIGVARLSPNWLIRKIAQVYVEVFRNTPVLILIIFLYVGVFLTLPVIGGGGSLFDIAFLSNRGAAIPWPRFQEGAGVWGATLLVGLVVGAALWWWRTRFNERTGRAHRRLLWSGGAFVAIAALGYVLAGGPIRFDVPELAGRFYEGGLQVSIEYAAILTGLVIYTAAFIAEIVRGSILAVPKGQKEAAEALGLTPFQQLRFVVLPQALRIAIPPINSQYLNLTKNSSLALAVGYPDIVSVSNTIINQKGRATQMLFIIMFTYLTMSLFISLVMNIVNRTVALRGEQR